MFSLFREKFSQNLLIYNRRIFRKILTFFIFGSPNFGFFVADFWGVCIVQIYVRLLRHSRAHFIQTTR